MESRLLPLTQPDLQFFACIRPGGTDFCKGEVTLGKLSAAAIYTVEDINHHIDRFVFPGDLINMEINVPYRDENIQSIHILIHLRSKFRYTMKTAKDRSDALLDEVCNVYPEGIITHSARLVKRKCLIL